MSRAAIHIGTGGWTYEPWRGVFYPDKLPHAKELTYAGEHLTAIEINATFHRLQKPESFRKWAATVPDGFVFAVKGSRYCTTRKLLAEAGESIEKFCAQGIAELGAKLGPLLWQLPATKKFDADDIRAFLALLPAKWEGVPLRHAIEVGHESFDTPEFVALAKAAGVAVALIDKPGVPRLDADTAGFRYGRLKAAREDVPTGYDATELDGWARTARGWGKKTFLFVINGAKVRAPAAAIALIERVGQ